MLPYWPQALAVTWRVLLWLFVFPLLVAPPGLQMVDRIAIGFLFLTAGAAVVTQSLAALRLYDPFALWAVLLAITVWVIIRRRTTGEPWNRRWMRALDWIEERQSGWFQLAIGYGRGVWQRFVAAIRALLRHQDLLTWMLGMTVVAWAAWLRFYPYLEKAYLGVAQAYQHLTWTKYLERSEMFRDGLYPFGYHAVMGAIASLTFLDRFLLFRFVGPISGIVLVLSIAFGAASLRLLPGAIVVAIALFGLGPGTQFPTDAFYQSHPVPDEFAAIFLLPAITLSWRFLREGDLRVGAGALASLFVAMAVQPFTLPYLVLCMAVLALCAGLLRAIPAARLGWYVLAWSGAAALAFIPLLVGRLLGKQWNDSFRWWLPKLTEAIATERAQMAGNFFLNLGVVLGIVLILCGVAAWRRRDAERAPVMMALGTTLLAAFTQCTNVPGIPALLIPLQARLVFGLLLSLGVGVLLDTFIRWVRATSLQPAIVAALLVAQVITWRPLPNHSVQLEYEDAVKAFIAISENYPRMLWTIVGPVEQYSQVLNVGWHEELGHFLQRVDVREVGKKEFQLYIPTPDIFFYVEKIPLFNQNPIQPDINAPVNFQGMDDPNVLYQRYQDPVQRRLMEQRIWGIVEAYAEAHPEEVTIFFESPEMRVYRIHHKPLIVQ